VLCLGAGSLGTGRLGLGAGRLGIGRLGAGSWCAVQEGRRVQAEQQATGVQAAGVQQEPGERRRYGDWGWKYGIMDDLASFTVLLGLIN
jgi:hypothetical protein